MSKIQLLKGDCLELLGQIEDKSVDLVLTDPPYNIGKSKEWDKWETQEDYIEWCGKWFLKCQRVLKNNGSMYFFHNDMLQIAMLMGWLRGNTDFVFNSFIIWDKGNFRALSWKNPSGKSKLRSWFNTCEYCLYYTFQDNDGSHYAAERVIKPYMNKQLEKCGYTKQELNKKFFEFGYTGTKSSKKAPNIMTHFFGSNSQNCLPTRENYERLQGITGYFQKPYEELRKEYEELRYTHNLDKNHNNIWISTKYTANSVDGYSNKDRLHPTQKPTDILERIIKTSSNEGDVVLDCFMGSGSTGVAAVNLNRDFIGIERDETYFEIAKDRIENAKIDLESK